MIFARNIVEEQFKEVQRDYPELQLVCNPDGTKKVHGDFHFIATRQGVTIEDSYKIEIFIDKDYPDSIPLVWETGLRISKEFHRNPDKTLCLEIPSRLRRMFQLNPTLLAFLNGPIVSFLFSHHIHSETGKMPFGEWNHGDQGIFEAYCHELNVDEAITVIKFLKIIINNSYRGHLLCPCGSGEKLRKCHLKKILDIINVSDKNELLYEAKRIFSYVKNSLGIAIPKDLYPKKIELEQ